MVEERRMLIFMAIATSTFPMPPTGFEPATSSLLLSSAHASSVCLESSKPIRRLALYPN
jgi:hypothetical protein